MQLTKSIMKYFSYVVRICLIFILHSLTSCNNSSSTTTLPGAWDKMGDFEGIPRGGSVTFTINGVAYVGGGFNYDAVLQGVSPTGRLADFWRYDALGDSWTQVADFPGTPRSQAVAFSLNGKGYVGTGTDGTYDLSDFYVFDPNDGTKGKWKQIADFGYSPDQGDTTISKRHGCIAFTVNDGSKDRAFVGGGHFLGDFKDLWEYDDVNNVWIERPSIGGSKRQNAFVFVINNIAYVGGGLDNGRYVQDFYKFDVTQLETGIPWIALNGLTGKDVNGNAIVQPKPRESASTFVIGNYGYLMCGNPGPTGDTWQYDPKTDSWLQYFSFTNNTPVAGVSRSGAVSFALTTNGKTYGYLTTGGPTTSTKYDDVWRFDAVGIEPDNK